MTSVANDPDCLVVKVQTALNDPTHAALIYDRERSFFLEVPPGQVAERMAGRVKVYLYARVRYGLLDLGDEAPEQDW